MFVRVDLSTSPPVVTLEEPDDTTRFHLQVLGSQVPGGADQGLVYGALVDAAAGRLEDDHAWISIDAVKRMAAGSVGDGWDAQLDAMVGYARGKGWVDDAGHAIRAHVEWPE